MPITQDRFLNILTKTNKILDLHLQLHKAFNESKGELYSNANSFLAHSQDPIGKEIVKEFLGLVNFMETIITDATFTYMETSGIVKAELKHFEQKGNFNKRMKEKRRLERYTKSAALEVNLELTSTETKIETKITQNMLRERAERLLRGEEVETIEELENRLTRPAGACDAQSAKAQAPAQAQNPTNSAQPQSNHFGLTLREMQEKLLELTQTQAQRVERYGLASAKLLGRDTEEMIEKLNQEIALLQNPLRSASAVQRQNPTNPNPTAPKTIPQTSPDGTIRYVPSISDLTAPIGKPF